jgi:hypothetical protein
MNTPPELPLAKPHPVDIALTALGEVAAELLASGKPSRFAELQNVTAIAMQIQRLRPIAGIGDVFGENGEDGEGGHFRVVHNPIGVWQGHRAPRFNDGADLYREIIMLAQNFLTQYAEAEKKKASKPDPDVRLNEVTELAELYMLRLKLAGADHDVPNEINTRIDQLLKRIGEPPHEPESSALVSAFSVRGHPPDGAGEPDGGRVGEPLAERAGGALDAG